MCSKTSEFPQPKPHPCNLVEVSLQRFPLENWFLSTGSMWPEAERCWALCGKKEVLEWESRIWGAGGGGGRSWHSLAEMLLACNAPEREDGPWGYPWRVRHWGAKSAHDREKSRTGPFTRLRA